MEDKETNKKATAVFQQSVDQVGSQACIRQNSMVSSNINKQKQTLRPYGYIGRVFIGRTWWAYLTARRLESRIGECIATKSSNSLVDRWKSNPHVVGWSGMLPHPCMSGHPPLLCCPAPHSSFRDLGQSSYLAKLKSHTRDLLWNMSRKRKDFVFLDSTVGCRHLKLPPNKRIYHMREVISPTGNPGTSQKLEQKMGSPRVINVCETYKQQI